MFIFTRRCPLEVGLHKDVSIDVVEMEEGKELPDFWRLMNVCVGERTKYHCLLDSKLSPFDMYNFHLLSVYKMQRIETFSETNRCSIKGSNPSNHDLCISMVSCVPWMTSL